MRALLKFSLDVQAANKAIQNGTFPKIIGNVMEQTKPEAAYFTTIGGTRTVFVFFDLKDTAQMPLIGEPLFQELNATIELYPVMNQQDLEKGLAALQNQH